MFPFIALEVVYFVFVQDTVTYRVYELNQEIMVTCTLSWKLSDLPYSLNREILVSQALSSKRLLFNFTVLIKSGNSGCSDTFLEAERLIFNFTVLINSGNSGYKDTILEAKRHLFNFTVLIKSGTSGYSETLQYSLAPKALFSY